MTLGMKNCRYCQTEISNAAKRCPHCAGDLRKWPARHKIIVGLLIVIILGSIAVVGSSKSKKADVAAAVDVDLKTMVAEYDQNQISADKNYAGRTIRISGYVNNVTTDLTGTPFIFIQTTSEKYNSGTKVKCYASDTEAAKATNGQPITTIGKVKGMSLGIITLTDCTVH